MNMKCSKCNGRLFLDRVFSDNKNYEVYCLPCGKRSFIQKNSEFGQWLTTVEKKLVQSLVR